jgi:uncharacterized protein involved in exopolysaccharide biosynthesis
MAFEIAVPEEDNRTLGDYLDALKRRRKPALLIAAGILVFGIIGIALWPNAYTSTAAILIEDPEVPPGLVPSTVTTFAARQIQYINQRVMTRTNLARIIEKFDLFKQERKYLPTLLLVDDVQNDISIDVIDVQTPGAGGQAINSTIAFTLGFEHESPQIARQVANELVSLYLAENVRSRTEQTAQTSQFLQAEVDRLEAEVQEIETRIATLKRENEGSLPELLTFNMQLMQVTDAEILEIERRLQSLAENKIMLDAQLAQLNPMSSSVLPDGKPISAPEDQLRALQTQLAMLEGRYNANHPDVLRVRRDLDAVKRQLGTDVDLSQSDAALRGAESELGLAREKYSADHPEVKRLERMVASLKQVAASAEADEGGDKAAGTASQATAAATGNATGKAGSKAASAAKGKKTGKMRPDNPVFIQIEAQRATLESEARSLVTKQNELRQRKAELEDKTFRTTEVEKDLGSLQRRLASTSTSYINARDRLFTAKMGQALETQSKGERFTLVEPPDLPLQPSSPNRPVLLALLLVLTLAAGLGWPQVAESMDAAITSARAVERVQGAPPIAEIPVIETAEDRRHETNVKVTALIIVPVLFLIAAALVHFFVINIDVGWYVLLRKLGM